MGEKSNHLSCVKCPSCGFENPEGFLFCGKCGTSMAALDTEKTETAIQSVPTELKKKMKKEARRIKGERRRVVVMFADISGFTELSRTKDPEELKILVDGAFAELADVVYQYEGYIDKVIGDSLMVLFGAPIAHEDDSERAVLCAFRLLETIAEYSRQKQVDLNLSIGIARGLCYAGEYGRPGDYTVIGRDVNLAERLQKTAPPGSIYASVGVYDLTHRRIDYKQIGERGLKGVGAQIVYEALAPASIQMQQRPFVGREEELSALCRMFEGAKKGEGSLCLITGERGIGKSRLYERFKTEFLDSEDVFFGQARGTGHLRSEFYHVLQGVLRSIVGIGEDLSADSAAKELNAFFKARNHLTYASPAVKHLLSLPMDEQERSALEGLSAQNVKANIEGMISSFLLRLSEEGPLVIAIEDAQYMDASSLSFFTEFTKLVRDHAVFIMVLCWELLEGFSRECLHIKVPPLSHNDILELVKLHFNGVPPSSTLLETIFKMTKGNPLFIEEIIEILKQDNLLSIGERVDLVTGKIKIPDRIYNVVLARIDKLKQLPKEVLKKAAVIGFEFTDFLLCQMGKGSTLAEHINTLERKDFIRYICDASYDDQKARLFIFKNEIIKDVAYELILKEDRMGFHKKLAEAMERLHTDNIDPFIDTIAYHYQEAADPRAADYILRSGIRKLEGYRLDEASTDFNRYLELCKELKIKENPEVYAHIGNLYSRKAEYEEAFEFFDKAEKVASDDDLLGKIRAMRGRIFDIQGRYEQAETELLAAAALVSSARNKAEVYRDLGSLHSSMGRYPKAMEYFKKGLEIARSELGERDRTTAAIYNNMAMVLSQRGDMDEALQHFKKSLEINRNLYGENHPNVASGYNNIAIVNARRGDYSAVIDGFKKALDIQVSIFGENHPQVSSYYNNLGMGYYYLRDYESAIDYVKKSIKILINHLGEDHPQVATYYNNIGQAYWHIGEFKQTLKYLLMAVDIWKKVKKPQPGMGMCYGNLGELYLLTGNYEEAGYYMNACYDIYTKILGTEHVEAARSIIRVAEYSFRIGDYSKAIRHFEHALKMFEEKFGEKHETTVYTYGWLGKVHAAMGEAENARDYFEKCLAGFEHVQGKNPDMGLLAFDYLVEEERYDEAERILTVATREVTKRKNRKRQADMDINRSSLEFARGNLKAACSAADRALEVAEELDLKPMLIDALLAKGRAWGDRVYIDRALALAREIGDKPRQEEAL